MRSKPMAPEQPAGSLPFLDAFYSLSDENPLVRARAGHSIVRHCFHTPDGVIAKDATYALGRLLDGLCSGRACARQGFAGCLASFLAALPEGSFGGKEGGRSDFGARAPGVDAADDHRRGGEGEAIGDEGLHHWAVVRRGGGVQVREAFLRERGGEKRSWMV